MPCGRVRQPGSQNVAAPIFHLREALGDESIGHSNGGYVICVGPENLDALEFHQVAADGIALNRPLLSDDYDHDLSGTQADSRILDGSR